MCKRDYKVEDFVLDPEFQKWVLSPDAAAKIYWEEYLRANPNKHKEIVLAKRLVVNMSRKAHQVEETRIEETWSNINQALNKVDYSKKKQKVIPIDSTTTLRQHEKTPRIGYHHSLQFYRMAGILTVVFCLSILINFYFPQPAPVVVEIPVEYEEHLTPPGVKSNLTLQDGSRVILNSGSSLRYIKNFEPHQRVLELEGEAFFEVAEDNDRPFIVKTGLVATTALGTSFNIKAYENESLDISLVTGRVLVTQEKAQSQQFQLKKGEGLQINLKADRMKRVSFNKERVLAWTHKTIIFDRTPMPEIKRVLENWYGVKISFSNLPMRDLEVSGRFQDQTLRNVLEGLSYSARFEFTIEKDKVILNFN
jgi:ferric-dicitrate binding protein FerR (iron transport regulator)